jgi:hypothetical protein
MMRRWSWLLGIMELSTAVACGGGAFVMAPNYDGAGPATDASTDSTTGDPAEADSEDAPDDARADNARPDEASSEDSPLAEAERDAGAQQDATGDVVRWDSNTPDGDGGSACTGKTVDVDAGVFVSLGGSTAGNCGSQQSPCSTVQAGLDRAYAASRTIVYVSHGTYMESISLRAGITLQGGWEVIGTSWTPNCVDPSGAVVIHAPPTATVSAVADNLGGLATISTLTLLSKAQVDVQPGESLYGVMATGATTRLTLDDVVVQTANGGDGPSGGGGATGPTGGPCSVDGDGGAGAPGAQGGGAEGGVFTRTGYMPGVGSAGSNGASGETGSEATPPTCLPCGSCTSLNCGFSPNGSQSCGVAGPPGCGGGGGGSGSGGRGGGSSVPLYVWDATVQIVAGTLVAGDGGTGGNGGPGGTGGPSGSGSTGSNGPGCTVRCSGLAVCTSFMGAGAGGTGGLGGHGGQGGVGGGGAGGSSLAIVQGGSAVVDVKGTLLAHGSAASGGGPDGGSGAAGMAADKWP